MTPARAAELALAIRLWHAHRQGGHTPYVESDLAAAFEALEMARACGEEVRLAYLASLASVPVMSVTITNLDVPRRRVRKPALKEKTMSDTSDPDAEARRLCEHAGLLPGAWEGNVVAKNLAAHCERLLTALEGERKANALLNAGMGSVCEGRDELKHRVRELEAEVAELQSQLDRWRRAVGDTLENREALAALEKP